MRTAGGLIGCRFCFPDPLLHAYRDIGPTSQAKAQWHKPWACEPRRVAQCCTGNQHVLTATCCPAPPSPPPPPNSFLRRQTHRKYINLFYKGLVKHPQHAKLCIYLLETYSTVNQPHRVTSRFFTKSNLTEVEYNTKRAHSTNAQTYQHNPKVSSFGIALIKYGK